MNKIVVAVGGLFCLSGIYGIVEKFTGETKEALVGTVLAGVICIVLGIVLLYLGIKKPEFFDRFKKNTKIRNTPIAISNSANYLEKLNIDTRNMLDLQEQPTAKQKKYARDIGISIPAGVTKTDLSCIIAKATGEESAGLPNPEIVTYAIKKGKSFSAYTTKARFIDALFDGEDTYFKVLFYTYCVYCKIFNLPLGDIDECPKKSAIIDFADNALHDNKILKSILDRPYDDFFSPNRNTIAFKSVQEYFSKI